MRIAAKATLAALAAGAVVAAGYLAVASCTPRASSVLIPDDALVGFESCRTSQDFRGIRDDLFARGTPISKESDRWVYAVDGRFMGVQIRRLELGVCDATGERGCGWALYTGLGLDLSRDEARAALKDKTGVDFTEERRDEEAGATMRPILSARGDTTRSLLFCDSGQL